MSVVIAESHCFEQEKIQWLANPKHALTLLKIWFVISNLSKRLKSSANAHDTLMMDKTRMVLPIILVDAIQTIFFMDLDAQQPGTRLINKTLGESENFGYLFGIKTMQVRFLPWFGN